MIVIFKKKKKVTILVLAHCLLSESLDLLDLLGQKLSESLLESLAMTHGSAIHCRH